MLNKIAADRFLKALDRLEYGSLDLTMPNGRRYGFEGKQPGAAATLAIEDWSVPARLAQNGDLGFAEAYRDGLWHSDDLQSLVTLSLQNEDAVHSYLYGNCMGRWMAVASYLMKMNSLRGSRRNIQAHYDLGNDFYKLWLDPTMTYSAALFGQDGDLTQAQLNKYDRIIDRLQAESGSVLEIGCGWGGFAERAAERGDYSIKGITLSDEQYEFARNRVKDRASIVLEDYRAQEGTFDNIVSIEMFEAVGEKYWQTYFQKVGGLLRRGGCAVIQTITIEDKRFETYRRGSDFIRSFIFPGGLLPSPERFAAEAAKSGLAVKDRFEFGQDYATTMEHWLGSFDRKIADVRQLGYDEGFIRLWRFYLAACIAGFRTGRTNVMQVELQHA
jgi:cyclopropane-fatty-acyl-phospholipid synthase